MRFLMFALFFVFSLSIPGFAQWYEPTPCYACDVDTSYSRQNGEYGLYGDDGRSLYDLGPSNAGDYRDNYPGITYADENTQDYLRGNTWGDVDERLNEQQHRHLERNFWQSQSQPRNRKPIAPCGPYYAPRAHPNCY